MKAFFSFLFLAAVVGGVVWYENQPQTITIPVETSDTIGYYEEPTITEPPTTVDQPLRSDSDFSHPDVQLEVHGDNGDEVLLQERIGKPTHLDDLPADVQPVIMDCFGVTDRDMVVHIQSRVELKSSLPAEVNADYETMMQPAVYEYDSGLTCDDGQVTHSLDPSGHSLMSYWVVLSGVVTPDHPDGDFATISAILKAPGLTLPNQEKMTYRYWGPRVVSCTGSVIGGTPKVWLAGRTPVGIEGNWDMQDCKPAKTRAQAISNN